MYSKSTKQGEKYERNQAAEQPDRAVKKVEHERYIPVMNTFIQKYARYAEELVALLVKISRLGKPLTGEADESFMLNVPLYTDKDLTVISCMSSPVRWETGIASVIEVIPRKGNIEPYKNIFHLRPSSSALFEGIFPHENSSSTTNTSFSKLFYSSSDEDDSDEDNF
ncbi:unnamed protein product [Ambrosiozyma monospora]|uniref:Unnamed protein product n=1 Tax=Ambrosiozyma monospora TaxID=43982 RepID=A0ACB5TPK5_AMBMO|nr:unnamed protein product [Ambrosiozyma monospora]